MITGDAIAVLRRERMWEFGGLLRQRELLQLYLVVSFLRRITGGGGVSRNAGVLQSHSFSQASSLGNGVVGNGRRFDSWSFSSLCLFPVV